MIPSITVPLSVNRITTLGHLKLECVLGGSSDDNALESSLDGGTGNGTEEGESGENPDEDTKEGEDEYENGDEEGDELGGEDEFDGELTSSTNWAEKSVIVHRISGTGFGIRLRGHAPIEVEHVHLGGAAWRAGVRSGDRLSKVNGVPVGHLSHKEVVLKFKACSPFIGLSLLSELAPPSSETHSLRVSSEVEYSNSATSREDLEDSSLSSNQAGCQQFWPVSGPLQSAQRRASIANGAALMGASYGSQLVGSSFFGCSNLKLPAAPRRSSSGRLCLSSQSSRRLLSSRTESANQGRLSGPRSSVSLAVERDSSLSLARTKEHPSILVGLNDSSGVQSTNAIHCINCRAELDEASHPTSPLACLKCQLSFPDRDSTKPKQLKPQIRQPLGSQQIVRSSLHTEQVTGKGSFVQRLLKEPGAINCMKTSHSASSISNIMQQPVEQQNQQLRSQNYSQQQQQPSSMPVSMEIQPKTLVIKSSSSSTTNKRLEIIKELIDTEKSHTDRLRCLDELFYRPLKAASYLSNEQLRAVFSCHRTLYKIHRQIYRILLSASYNLCSEPMIGSALLEIFEGDLRRRLERAACSFCASQSTNTQLLNKLTRKDTKPGELIAQVTSQQMVGRLGIKDLLASCFQRLTKYPLLLENLLKATPETIPDDWADTSHLGKGTPSPGNQDNRLPMELDRNSRRMLAIGLAEEREFIGRALEQSRKILFKVNESVKEAISHIKLREIWKRTDKYPGVPSIDISNQQVIHEGQLTLRLSRRSFEVYVLLLTDYLVILTREGQDKYRLKFFTPDSSNRLVSAASGSQGGAYYSPVFVVDEHLSTRDAATDENGFYLLCKRKDDSRIYEFATRSPGDRVKWREKIQWTIEHQMDKSRRPSCDSTITKSSSEISRQEEEAVSATAASTPPTVSPTKPKTQPKSPKSGDKSVSVGAGSASSSPRRTGSSKVPGSPQKKECQASNEPGKIEGTISYVEDDGIVMPNEMESSRALVEQAVQVRVFAHNAQLLTAVPTI